MKIFSLSENMKKKLIPATICHQVGNIATIVVNRQYSKANSWYKTKWHFLSLVLLLVLIPGMALAQTTVGPNNAGTGTNVSGIGSVAWTNPGNALANENSYATISLTSGNTASNYLQTTNYGFSIPAGAIINGIQLTIGRFENNTASGNDIRDVAVQLIKGGSLVASNQANTGSDWPTSETAATYGGATSLWGTTWTPADINATNFGASLAINTSNTTRTGSVDYMTITVTYVVLASEPTTQATNVTFTSISSTGMTINWAVGNGTNHIVLVKSGSIVNTDPVDGSGYTANTVFGSGGSQIGSTGNYVVYNGIGSSVPITGLTANTTYYVAVYEFNGSGGTQNYLTSTPAAGSQATVDPSILQYRSATSGNWGTAGTWEVSSDGGTTWFAASSSPTSANSVITIRNTHIITVSSSVTIDQSLIAAGGEVDLTGGTLTIANGTGIDLDVSGIFRNSNTTAITTTGTIVFQTGSEYHDNVGASSTIPTASWDPNSTCFIDNWNASGNTKSNLAGQTFGNFIIDNTSGTSAGTLLPSGGTMTCAGNFTFTSTGRAISLVSTGLTTATLNVAKDFINSASNAFTLNNGTGQVYFNLSGNFTNSNTFAAGSGPSTVTLNGSGSQIIGGTSSATFNNLTLNNSSGATLGRSEIVNGTLTLTSGILNTSSANLLSVTNTGTAAISGGTTSSFINGPVNWTLPASLVSVSTYLFPVGNGTTFLPFSLVNPTTGTGTVTAQVEALPGNLGLTSDGSLSSLSTGEQWSLGTSGNFTGSSVSLTRQSSLGLLNVIGGSTSLTGPYTSLRGTIVGNGVSNSNAIGANRFFVLAEDATPTINLSSPSQVTVGNVQQGLLDAHLSTFQAAVPFASATLNNLTFTSGGSYLATDINNFELYYSTLGTFPGGTPISTLNSSLESGPHTFTGFTQTINSGTTGYFWITSDISTSAADGHAIDIDADPTLTFTVTVTQTGTISAGGVQTIVNEPAIVISSASPAVISSNILQNTTNNVIYAFENAVTVNNATISGLQITTSGSYSATDLTNLKAWYSADNTFNESLDLLLSTITSPSVAGLQIFPSWTNQVIANGTTGYIFITADLPCAAAALNSIIVNAVTTADVTFLAGNKSGSTSAGGAQTIQLATPVDVTGPAASVADAQSNLSWTAPTGCYSQVMIVVKASSSITVTPTGDGSAYTGSLTFGSGDTFDGGYIVYKGTASPQTVINLTNNTTYYIKFFVHNGSNWSGGVEITVKPVRNSQTNDYFRSKQNGNWGDIATWESSPDNSLWNNATLTPTSAANTITIMNLHTVTVAASVTVDQVVVAAGGQVTINSGSAITLNDGTGTDMSVSGKVLTNSTSSSGGFSINTGAILAFNSGGILEYNVDGDVIPTATWDVNSTCLITGYLTAAVTTNFQSSLAQSFGNFEWNCPSQGNIGVSFGGSLQTINGNLTITSTGSSGGNIQLANNASPNTVVLGKFKQTGGTLILCNTSGTTNLNLHGDFEISGGTLQKGSGNGIINFTGNVKQTYLKTGGIFSGAINFAVNPSATGAIVDFGTSLLDGSSGSFNLNSGGGIITAHLLGLSTTLGTGTIQVTGTKTFNISANYTYNGTSAQETGNGLSGAANLTINNSTGVTLTRAVSVSGTLNLTSGILTTTGTNLLSITNTNPTTAILRGSPDLYINGPLKWTLEPSMLPGPTYNFPVGSGTTYLPFSLVNPSTGTGVVTAQVESLFGSTGGTSDATLSSLSNTEYWSLSTTGNFTNSLVSITRQTDITPLNAIGGSPTKTGAYTSLGGTPGTKGISNSILIGSNRYFVFAEKSTFTTETITGSPFCQGNSVSVPFTTTGVFNPGNSFTAQLSDLSGSFASPVNIGTLSQTGSGTITGTILLATPAGTGYRIRVVSSNPIIIGSDNGSDLIVNALPVVAPILGGASIVCVSTSTPAFTCATASGNWSLTKGTGDASMAPDGVVTGISAGTVTVVYTYSDGTCSNTSSIGLTVQEELVLDGTNVYSNSPVCYGSTLELHSPSGGSTYTWYKDGNIISNDPAPSFKVDSDLPFVADGLYQVYITNECNLSPGYVGVVFVTVNTRPVPNLSGPTPVCNNSTSNVYTTDALMTNYIWTVSPGGQKTAGGTSNDNYITITWNIAGAQYVKVNYTDGNGCTAASDKQFDVTVNPLPATNLTVTAASPILCTGNSTNITVAGSLATTKYELRNSADNTIIISSATGIGGTISLPTGTLTSIGTPRTITFNVLATIISTGCTAQLTTTPSVTVNPVIANNIISPPPPICSGFTPDALTGVPSGGDGINYAYLWESSTDNITFGNASVPNNQQTYSPGVLIESIWYRRTVTSGGCSDLSPAVKVTVNPLPAIVVVTGGGTVCNSTTLNALNGVGGTIFFQGTTSGRTSIADSRTSVPVTSSGTYYFRSLNMSTGCWGPEGSATVTIADPPATLGVTICKGGSGVLISSSTCPVSSPTSSSPRFAGAGVTGGGGGTAWTNTGDIVSDNGTGATVNLGGNGNGQNLNATGFGFTTATIPANAIIKGISVDINRWGSTGGSSNNIEDVTVSLIKGGTVTGNNNAVIGQPWSTTPSTVVTYGGTTDMWGTTWTPAQINDPNFGVTLDVTNGSGSSRIGTVDYIQITVTYTVPGVLNWYTTSSGGTSVQTGAPFNPVNDPEVLAQLGIYAKLGDTQTAGIYPFYSECSSVPGCRTRTDFVINPAPDAPVAGILNDYTYDGIAHSISASVTGPNDVVDWYAASSGGTRLTTTPALTNAESMTYYAQARNTITGCISDLPRTPVILTIHKADLVVTAVASNIIYGDLAPVVTVNYSGFQGTDNASVLDNVGFALGTDYTQFSPVGTYHTTIAIGTATDNNYNFTPLNTSTL
jgi:MBG domain (YGX type)/Ig-like domain CHU_C associated